MALWHRWNKYKYSPVGICRPFNHTTPNSASLNRTHFPYVTFHLWRYGRHVLVADGWIWSSHIEDSTWNSSDQVFDQRPQSVFLNYLPYILPLCIWKCCSFHLIVLSVSYFCSQDMNDLFNNTTKLNPLLFCHTEVLCKLDLLPHGMKGAHDFNASY